MQLELRDYLNVLIKRWWVILLVVIGAAVAGLGYSLAQTPIYRAQVQMEAIPNRPDNGLVEYLIKSLPSYVTGLQSRDFVNSVLLNAQIGDAKADTVLGAMKVQAQPDLHVIVLTVDDKDPAKAAALANALADSYVLRKNAEAQTQQSDQKIFLQKVDTARPPEQPVSPNKKLNTAAAAVLGLVLGLLLAFGLEFADTTLKTADDVQRYLGLTTVGLIPAYKQRGPAAPLPARGVHAPETRS
jgi:capsular polysaccharide biosynthesis protein